MRREIIEVPEDDALNYAFVQLVGCVLRRRRHASPFPGTPASPQPVGAVDQGGRRHAGQVPGSIGCNMVMGCPMAAEQGLIVPGRGSEPHTHPGSLRVNAVRRRSWGTGGRRSPNASAQRQGSSAPSAGGTV